MNRAAITFVLLTVAAAPLTAQRTASTPETRATRALRPEAVWGPLRFLADDLLEGRGTGARGGELAAHYVASQFMALGLEPAGDNGTYFHEVPILVHTPTGRLAITAGAAARELRYRDDFVLWSERGDVPRTGPGTLPGSQRVSSEAIAELVFVGFGITAPEWDWDDYKGVDVRGKIVMMLVNDPGLRDPSIFRGRVLTYYGRWTYKIEEAARRGAIGLLLVHNDTMATYGWNTVRNSWTGDQVRLLGPSTSLMWAGWIRQNAAAELLASRGWSMDSLMRAAARRDFRPVATGLTLHGDVASDVRLMTTANVLGRLPGSDPALRDEIVILCGHYDHHGIGEPVNGDSIMNGALDNASGVATVLAIADAFVRSGVRPRRSVVFIAFAAEEKGLLGSQAFAVRPTVPLANVAAVINLDVTNLYGVTRDIAALGTDQSSLGPVFERAARAEGLRVTTDEQALLQGSFFRSDHFPLAKMGVPGLSFESGDDFVGRPAGWAREVREEYTRNRYHQVDDELLDWYTVDGALQQARVAIRVALAVANAPHQPGWNAASEFRAAGEARRQGR